MMLNRAKKVLSIIIPCALSLVLLTWLFVSVDYRGMWQVIADSDAFYISLAIIIFFLINFLIIWRWRILMKALGLKSKRLSSIRWYFIGLFGNLAPISTVGNDMIRGLGLAKETGYKPKVFASIVLDRLSGFAGIVILAAAAFLFAHKIIARPSVAIAIFALIVVSILITMTLFSYRIYSFACKAFEAWPKVKDGLMRLHYDIVLLKGKQRQGWESIFISIAAQIVLAVEFYLTAKAVHQDIGLVYFIIFSPIVCVVTSVPSIGGLGFREIGWVYLLSLVGVPKEAAGALSLINSAFTIVIGLLGGLFYVTTLSSGRLQYSQSHAVDQRPAS